MFARLKRNWFRWLLAAYVVYALGFILNSSVFVHEHRYFVLVDDAMITMTYARNLAEGHGAVWYPGVEPVQGYSTPMWMLYMAAVHRLPLSEAMICLPIQLTGALVTCGLLWFVKAIAERLAARENGRRSQPPSLPVFAPLLAVSLTALYLPLNNWTLRGMEVGLLALGTAAAVWALMHPPEKHACRWWLLPLLGLLTAIRIDAAVVSAAALLWLACDRRQRRVKTLLVGAAWIGSFLIGQVVFQKLYYNDWLSNPYYLKLAGTTLLQRAPWGAYVLFCFVLGMGVWPAILAALGATRSWTASLLAALIGAQACYSVYVGGDAWEWWGGANRYLCVVMPLAFVLMAIGVERLVDWLVVRNPRILPRTAARISWSLGLLLLLQVNSYDSSMAKSLRQCLLLAPPPEADEHQTLVRQALAIRATTSPRTTVAVSWAGVIPYFSQRRSIDLLGKNDRHIAKGPCRSCPASPFACFASAPFRFFWPGHMKYDYQYSIGVLAPDLIAQRWLGMEEVDSLLARQYKVYAVGDQVGWVKRDTISPDPPSPRPQ